MRFRPLVSPSAVLLLVCASCTLFGAGERGADAGGAGEPTDAVVEPAASAVAEQPAAAGRPALAEAALGGLDPVLLCRGDRFPGDPQLRVQHEGNEYRFVDADSQATFLVDPGRYAIQLGGACARMGALSGPGSPQRFLVHDGRIYAFASDACRDGFAQAPARCLFSPAPPPEGAEADGEADALWQQAAAAHGDAWHTLRWAASRATGEATVTTRTAIAAAGALRVDTDYVQGDKVWRYARAVSGDEGWFVDDGTPRPMYAAARRAMLRELHREPLVALRHDDGTRSVRGEAREVCGAAVTEVLLWFDGEVVAFGVDAEHHVRSARFRGLGADQRYCEVVQFFDDLRPVGGVLVPTTVRVFHDGVEQPGLTVHRSDVQVDDGVPADWFTAPGS
ncbi:MAG: hypothetical protein H6835_06070 [Planctomycetes bacterium]|nr:hypothetical protein [Planctomycetota bacterium]